MKALVGSWDRRPYQLLAEVTALRGRVAQLQDELEAAREENAQLRRALAERLRVDGPVESRDDEREVALSTR